MLDSSQIKAGTRLRLVSLPWRHGGFREYARWHVGDIVEVFDSKLTPYGKIFVKGSHGHVYDFDPKHLVWVAPPRTQIEISRENAVMMYRYMRSRGMLILPSGVTVRVFSMWNNRRGVILHRCKHPKDTQVSWPYEFYPYYFVGDDGFRIPVKKREIELL